MELKDVARPVAFLAKMTSHRPLAIQLLNAGLLEQNRMRRLLSNNSCPKEVILDVLMIISDLARMDKVMPLTHSSSHSYKLVENVVSIYTSLLLVQLALNLNMMIV